MPIVVSSAAMQASLLTVPGGSYFSSPLGVALSSYMEEPQCRAALLEALMHLALSPDTQRLAQLGAPDQQPETALVCLHSRLQETRAPRHHQDGKMTWISLHSLLRALACTAHNGAQICSLRSPGWGAMSHEPKF